MVQTIPFDLLEIMSSLKSNRDLSRGSLMSSTLCHNNAKKLTNADMQRNSVAVKCSFKMFAVCACWKVERKMLNLKLMMF